MNFQLGIGYHGRCLSLTYTELPLSISFLNFSVLMAGFSLVKYVQLKIYSKQLYSSVKLAWSSICCVIWTNETSGIWMIESRKKGEDKVLNKQKTSWDELCCAPPQAEAVSLEKKSSICLKIYILIVYRRMNFKKISFL